MKSTKTSKEIPDYLEITPEQLRLIKLNQLARDLGVPPSTIYMVFQGHRQPKKLIKRINDKLRDTFRLPKAI